MIFLISCKNDDGIGNGVDRCYSDKDCEIGEICTNFSNCIEGERCSAEKDCSSGKICSEEIGLCLGENSCKNDSDCLRYNMRCIAGICIGCEDDSDCAENLYCTAGACVESQNGCKYIECENNQWCNPLTTSCEDIAVECSYDNPCPFGLPCIDGYCKPLENGCQDSSDCKNGLDCNLGVCTGCSGDSDCKFEQQCIFGACISSDINLCEYQSCEIDELCDPKTGQCYPKNGKCYDEQDCRPGTLCQYEICMGCVDENSCHPDMRCIMTMCVK